jgi:hypothetical protein
MILFLIVSLVAPSVVLASQSNSIIIEMDGKNVLTGVSTVRIKGLTYVPLLPIVKAFGGTSRWDGSQKATIIKVGKTTVSLNPSKSQVYIDGIKRELGTSVQVSGGVTLVPYYFFYLTLGIETDWLPNKKKLVLKMNNHQLERSTIRGEYGDLVEMEHPLIKKDSQIMVPAKKLMSAFFGELTDSSLDFQHGNLKVVYNDAFRVSFQDGSNIAKFNGHDLTMPTAAYLYKEDLYVPLEFIARLLYLKIKEAGSDYVTIKEMSIYDISEFYRTWNAEKTNGKGKVTFDALNWYEGDIVNGTIQGKGAFYRNGYLYYEGEVSNGVPNGSGIVYLVDVPEPIKWYEGSFVDGKMQGHIKEYIYNRFEKKNDLFFEGEFSDNERNGAGKFFYNDGVPMFEGQFKNGKRHGYGVSYNFWGDPIFKGNYKNDLYDGQGTLISGVGFKYEGQFLQGLPTGEGTFLKHAGAGTYVEPVDGTGFLLIDNKYIYIGEVHNGMANGEGVLHEGLSRTVYEGEFLNNKFHGQGTYFDVSLDKLGESNNFKYNKYHFVGTFESGSLSFGKKYVDTGNRLVYEGQLSRYKPHGLGKEFDEFGDVVYEGNFENGERNGKGVQYSESGKKSFEGTYKEGEFLYGKSYRADGKILFEGTVLENEYFEGTMWFVSGYRYEGRIEKEEFIDGIFYDSRNRIIRPGTNGAPDRFYIDGSVFYGKLEKGKGTGTIHMVDGMKYSGEFFILPNGNGKIFRSDGSLLYKGTVLPNYNGAIWSVPDGEGKVYSPQGKVIAEGIFEFGFYRMQLQQNKGSDLTKELKEFEHSITFVTTKEEPGTYKFQIKDDAYYNKFSEMALPLRVDLAKQYLIKNKYWIENSSAKSISFLHKDKPVMLTLFKEDTVYTLLFPEYWVN